jgi:tricorn protease-like protein
MLRISPPALKLTEDTMKKLPFIRVCALCFAALASGCGDGGDVNGPPPTGSIQMNTSTTGYDLDPDGYTCRVDGVQGGSVGINDTEVISNVATGDHSVELTGVQDNCTVSGDNPRTVTILHAGHTAPANFDVTCSAVTGALEVTTVTVGDTLDPNGYTLTLDATTAEAIAINGTVTFPGLEPGSHSVELSGVAKNCSVSGENPRTVTITVAETTPVSFGISCAVALFDHIAFRSDRDGNYEVYVMDADGSNPVRLTNSVDVDKDPAWSPDGTRIAFASDRDGNSEVYVMNADGSNPINLTNSAGADWDPAWSPDGTRIAFASFRDGNNEVYVMDADGSNPVRLTNSVGADKDPAWSPDGTRIAFLSTRDGNYEVYVMNADGSNPINLTNSVGADKDPAWSPDGTRIAFLSTRDGNPEVYVMNADGSNPVRLTNNTRYDRDPAWSPDGTRIAFVSDRDWNYEVYVMDADGSNPRNLTNNAAHDREPAWSPIR